MFITKRRYNMKKSNKLSIIIIIFLLLSQSYYLNKITMELNSIQTSVHANINTISMIMTHKRLENKSDYVDYYIELEKLNTIHLIISTKTLSLNRDDIKRETFFSEVLYNFKQDFDKRIIGNVNSEKFDNNLSNDIYTLNRIIDWYIFDSELTVEELIDHLNLENKYFSDDTSTTVE